MAILKTYSITTDDMNSYYNPLVNRYKKMSDSIDANGYGQTIFLYNNGVIDQTFYNVWDVDLQMMIISDDFGGYSTEYNAGPQYWGITSQEGLDFINGIMSVTNLKKLKYCNVCSDRNGLKLPVVQSFVTRFMSVQSMLDFYRLSESYLLYDFSLPKYQNFYPSAKVYNMESGLYDFYYKNYQGSDITITDVELETGSTGEEINSSIDTPTPIIPTPISYNSSVISCCDGVKYIIEGQYDVGSVLTFLDDDNKCWEVLDNLVIDRPNYIPTTFGNSFRDCSSCQSSYPCPALNSIIQSCCTRKIEIISGQFSINTTVYTKELLDMCWSVIGNTSDPITLMNYFTDFPNVDCKKCQNSYPCR